MAVFEVLCVTMHQKDFSKIKQMNLHSNIVFANQGDRTAYEEMAFDGYTARMISTQTRGVGVNRNLALMHAKADICLLADDDVWYKDEMEVLVTSEFEAHPDADVMIFHFDSDDPKRKLSKYKKTKKRSRFSGLPFGGIRIAFRLNSVKKANVWFTTLLGGGCVFPSGEDSMFLQDLKRAGLKIYVSKETIGTVSFATSTWFTGYDQRYYFGKGAFYQAARPKLKYLWMLYMALRTYKKKELSFSEKLKWMNCGSKGYKKLISYDDYVNRVGTPKC